MAQRGPERDSGRFGQGREGKERRERRERWMEVVEEGEVEGGAYKMVSQCSSQRTRRKVKMVNSLS